MNAERGGNSGDTDIATRLEGLLEEGPGDDLPGTTAPPGPGCRDGFHIGNFGGLAG